MIFFIQIHVYSSRFLGHSTNHEQMSSSSSAESYQEYINSVLDVLTQKQVVGPKSRSEITIKNEGSVFSEIIIRKQH